ncbi:heliorhodopsin HeR [Actinospongicola halichondriae]|uniref:heliorhodopsin HeR n=1 Tax=Actinospongicola halichondriae TaxID=3236844 RepID=UPI003D517928
MQGGQTIDVTKAEGGRLRRWNVAMGLLHAVSGALMLALGDGTFELPVSVFSLGGPPGTSLADGDLYEVVGVPLALGTAGFLFLSALFHGIIATVGFDRYLDELRHGRNRFRWIEYSLSATLMIVLIALVTGIADLAALIAIAIVNATMILCGWLMEVANPPGRERTWWTPFVVGSIAGAGPWIAIVAVLVSNATRDGAATPPGFVYGIIVSIFLLFNCFALNQWLQFRGRGRFADYLHGERVYIVLSLVAKSALAWQIFANTLI